MIIQNPDNFTKQANEFNPQKSNRRDIFIQMSR